MRSKIFIPILILAFATNARSQTFIKYFGIDSFSTNAYSLKLRQNYFFVGGIYSDTSTVNGVASFLAKFDYSGNLISTANLRPPQFGQYATTQSNSLISTSDNGFASAGYAQDSGGTFQDYICFTKYDSNGIVQFYKTYNFPGISNYLVLLGYNTIQYGNKYFISGTIELTDYSFHTILLRIDSAGNLERNNGYTTSQLYSSSLGLCQLTNGNLLIACYSTDDNINYWQRIDNTCYIETDTACNLVRQYCTSDSNTFTYYCIDTTYDGSYLSCGNYYSYRVQGLEDEFSQYITKIDTNYNSIWSLKVGDAGSENTFTAFKQNQQHNIFLSGYVVNGDTGTSAYSGTLTSVDTGGNTIWYRQYKVPTGINMDSDISFNYLYDIELMPDGGILAVGFWQNNTVPSPINYQMAGWIIRVDSNGCMDDGTCGYMGINTPPSSSTSAEPFQVMPNPSNGIFTVKAASNIPPMTTIQIYDATGNKLADQPLINSSSMINLYRLTNGVYFYKIGNGLANFSQGKIAIEK